MGVFTGKRKIQNAQVQGSRSKFTPGTYFSTLSKGVYVESKNDNGTYFGVETTVVHVISGFSAEDNAPYAASLRRGQPGNWVFNIDLKPTYQYLADGNIKNVAQAIIDTHGFEEACGEDFETFVTIYEAYEEDNPLPEGFCRENGILDSDGNPDTVADPFAWVSDRLIEEGGERFVGLPLKVVATDKRNKKDPNANLFTACTLSGVSAEEMVEYFGANPSILEAPAA